MDEHNIITAYFGHTLDLDDTSACSILIQALLKYSVNEIIENVSQAYSKFEITTADIPQYSSIEDCFKTPYLIEQSGIEKVDFIKMGFLLVSGATRKKIAYQKYGENQGKMAVMFGLLKLNSKQKLPNVKNPRKSFSATSLGLLYNKLSDEEKAKVRPLMMLRGKLMQNFFLRGRQENLLDEDIKHILSESTYKRRSSNIKFLKETINQAL